MALFLKQKSEIFFEDISEKFLKFSELFIWSPDFGLTLSEQLAGAR